MDDEELLQRVAERRDEEAFRLLYARHSAPVYGLLCRLAGRNGDASDLLQETWLRAVRHLSLFRGQSAFRTWLTGIALNCYREWRRRHARDAALIEAETRPLLSRAADDVAAVAQVLAALAPEHREVIVLHDVEGFTHEEIAAALEIEPGTSKSRLSRARRAFRQRWHEDGP
jgi:RNA polymerase sigma-70 factor (ECF subfamily)